MNYDELRNQVSNALISKTPFDVLDFWYPDELEDLIGMKQGKQHNTDVLQHSISVLTKTSPILPLRMAALLHDTGKALTREVSDDGKITFKGHEAKSAIIAKKLLTELGYDPDFIHTVAMLCHNHMRTKQFGNDIKSMSNKAIRRIMVNAGKDFDLLLELIHADNCSHKKEYCMPDQVQNIKDRISKFDHPLDNWIERSYTGLAYYQNNEFHNNRPEIGDFFEGHFSNGELIEVAENIYSITQYHRYPVHVVIK
jgi:hypothetical protein